MQGFQPQRLARLILLRSPICQAHPLPGGGSAGVPRRASHVASSSSGVLQRDESILETGRSWQTRQPVQPEPETASYGGGGGGGRRAGVGHSRDGGDDGESGGLSLPWNPFLM